LKEDCRFRVYRENALTVNCQCIFTINSKTTVFFQTTI